MSNARELTSIQARLAAAAILSVLGVLVLADLAARGGFVREWIEEQQRSRRERTFYVERGPYIDIGSRLFLETLPQAGFEQGGVHFFGTSNLAAAFHPGEVPQDWARRTHLFALGGASHLDQGHLIRYLVEEEGLLAAGGEKNLVVFALFYGDAIHAESGTRFGELFPTLCERYGLYTYDRERGLGRVPMTVLGQFLRTEQARCFNLVTTLWRETRAAGELRLGLAGPTRARREHDVAAYQATWRGLMGGDWEAGMDVELGALASTIDYLRDLGAPVAAVLMPIGGWHRDLPHARAYKEQVSELLAAREVLLLDLSESTPDDQFADHSHLNVIGAPSTHRALMEIAGPFLAEGVVPRPLP